MIGASRQNAQAHVSHRQPVQQFVAADKAVKGNVGQGVILGELFAGGFFWAVAVEMEVHGRFPASCSRFAALITVSRPCDGKYMP